MCGKVGAALYQIGTHVHASACGCDHNTFITHAPHSGSQPSMGDFIRRFESTDRLDRPVVPEVKVVDLAPDDDQVPDVVRRKSSVRFLEEVTTIESDAGEYAAAAAAAAVRFGRSLSPNHKYSPYAFGGASKISEEEEEEEGTMSNLDSTPSSIWTRNRKEREARLQQKIMWLRDEIAKLKQQDQSLMRQFLQLRSVIFQLKSSSMSPDQRPGDKYPRTAASEDSLATGRARYAGSADGLEVLGENDELMFGDDEYDSPYDPDDPMGLSEDPYLPEFRGRTVSLLNPANITKPRVANGGFGYLKSRTMSFSVGTSARELDRAIME